MAEYKLELLLEAEGKTLALIGKTQDVTQAWWAYQSLIGSWRTAHRDMVLPEMRIYKDNKKIDENLLLSDYRRKGSQD